MHPYSRRFGAITLLGFALITAIGTTAADACTAEAVTGVVAAATAAASPVIARPPAADTTMTVVATATAMGMDQVILYPHHSPAFQKTCPRPGSIGFSRSTCHTGPGAIIATISP